MTTTKIDAIAVQAIDVPVPQSTPTALSILDAAVRGGITTENISVVKEIIQMRREELAEQAKAEFAKAFFRLKKTLATTEIYADKAAQHNGKTAYVYCSEEEINRKLEPLLLANGFALLFGQRNEDGKVVAIITIIHEGGHQEVREFAVRVGSTNAMKDATAADTGSTTSAWRHSMIKIFGLKSRITIEDARVEGDPNAKITEAQAAELEDRAKLLNMKMDVFFRLAGANKFSEIPARNYDVLSNMLREKERMGK